MDEEAKNIQRVTSMFVEALDALKQNYNGQSVIEILRDELDALHAQYSVVAAQPFPSLDKNSSTLKFQQDKMIKALIGAERLAYLIKAKHVPLLPEEEKDMQRICAYADESIRVIEALNERV